MAAPFLLSAAACFAFAGGVEAGVVCQARESMVVYLERAYNEVPRGIGVGVNGHVFEILTSPAGTWTMIRTDVEGRSCLMASGDNWEMVKRVMMDPAA